MVLQVDIKRLANVPIPKNETTGATGIDLPCYFINPDTGDTDVVIYDKLNNTVNNSFLVDREKGTITIPSGYVAFLRTYLSISYPSGYAVQVDTRSSSAKKRYRIANTRGHIDSDYTGQIYVPIHNWGNKDLILQNGTKLVQLYAQCIERIEWIEKTELQKTKRGSGGFGSTDNKKAV